MARDKNTKIEFGDFQTPRSLARDVCSVIERTGFSPASIIEPTCGRGAFLVAALEAFPGASHFLGVDQEGAHVREATRATNSITHDKQVQILQGDFFDTDWSDIVARLPKPILVVGNPPWVTNSTLGSLGSANLPAKANEDNLRGIDALTGKSNFDISEWMLRKNAQWLADTPGVASLLMWKIERRSSGIPSIAGRDRHRREARRGGYQGISSLAIVALRGAERSRFSRPWTRSARARLEGVTLRAAAAC